MSFGDILRQLSQYIGWITVIIGAGIAVSKRMRHYVQKIVLRNSNAETIAEELTEIKKDVETLLDSADKSNLVELSLQRNEITNIYYENIENKTLKSYQKENLMRLYDAYCAKEGNSYVKTIMNDEMSHWAVEP